MNISPQNQYITASNATNGLHIAAKAVESGNSLPLENKPNDTHQVMSGRESLLEKVVNASPDEMDKILNDISGSGTHGMMIFFNGSLPDLNDKELMGRLERINNDFRAESNDFSNERKNLIANGKQEGKSSEEIIADIIGLYDQQSELFKTGSGWNGDVISGNKMNSDGYKNLLELTPAYVNSYA